LLAAVLLYAPYMTAVVISICALVVSLVSLGWQVVSWLRTGPVIKVKAHSAMPVVQGVMGDHHTAVTVENRGRGPATVTSWGFVGPNDRSLVTESARLPGVEPLPHRLESHTEASWYIRYDDLGAACRDYGIQRSELRPFVIVAGRTKKIVGKRLG
jgi:hypothetical protein